MAERQAAGEPIRRRVIFSGRVQGVGFRYTAQRLAEPQPVTGFVRNQADGTVELEAQGSPQAVGAYLAAVREQFTGYISDETVTDLPVRGDDTEFAIRY